MGRTVALPYDVFFFFFQAEDGIRDYKVTGVQTCALPISAHGPRALVQLLLLRARQAPRPEGAGHPAERGEELRLREGDRHRVRVRGGGARAEPRLEAAALRERSGAARLEPGRRDEPRDRTGLLPRDTAADGELHVRPRERRHRLAAAPRRRAAGPRGEGAQDVRQEGARPRGRHEFRAVLRPRWDARGRRRSRRHGVLPVPRLPGRRRGQERHRRDVDGRPRQRLVRRVRALRGAQARCRGRSRGVPRVARTTRLAGRGGGDPEGARREARHAVNDHAGDAVGATAEKPVARRWAGFYAGFFDDLRDNLVLVLPLLAFFAFVIVPVSTTLLCLAECGSGFGDWWTALWITAQAMTTLGFDDVAPVTPAGRLIAGSDAVLGYTLIGVLVFMIARSAEEEGKIHRD